MSFFATLDKENPMSAKLKVVGVGGCGCNAIEYMIAKGLTGVEYVAINTDAQVLAESNADTKIQIGVNETKGLGAGADPALGRKAAEEDRENITETLAKCDMVFVTCGMGGGTGTGAAPLVASIAKNLGALVVGIVTKPFKWEGRKRMLDAEQGIQDLRQYVDSMIVIPNQRLIGIIDINTSANDTFAKPNEVLYEATRGIADIITIRGVINVDFADVRTVMNQSGEALMGSGMASGENRAVEAAQKAISSPLLEGASIKGAKNVLVNITAASNFTMAELDAGASIIHEAAGEDVNIILGWVNKEEMSEYVSFTVIATGFDNSMKKSREPKPAENHASQNSSSSQSPQQKGKSEQPEFNFRKDDLEIPTYLRVNAGAVPFDEEDEVVNSGFMIDRLSNYASQDLMKDDSANWNDEEDNSFLKMMMD
jgi:cell division protein FtsZ